MRGIKNSRLTLQALTAVLLFNIAYFASGATVTVVRPPNPNVIMAPGNTSPAAPGGLQTAPALICGMNSTPHISSIYNKSSASSSFKPGDKLDIVGCGFGKGGTVSLVDPQMQNIVKGLVNNQSVTITSWNETNIIAQIIPSLTGAPDIDFKVQVMPNGAAVIISPMAKAFIAARQTYNFPLPTSNTRLFAINYTNVWGAWKGSVTGHIASGDSLTTIEHKQVFSDASCHVADPNTQMVDRWKIAPLMLPKGYQIVGVVYFNGTPQNVDDLSDVQDTMIGNQGRAEWDAANSLVTVMFQGHSSYLKKQGLMGGVSTCYSKYGVRLQVSGPRGLLPIHEEQQWFGEP